MPLPLPFISIIIPCRNEELLIGKCLDSILTNTFPKQRMEILVVDGMSNDATMSILKSYKKHHPLIHILENKKKIIPAAMNIGIRHGKGDIIIKMDAHTIYNKDYIAKCIEYLQKYHADNVGGILINRPRNNSLTSSSIAFCLSHVFGSGNSYFKTGSDRVRFVDTVAFGCYPKDTFKRIGLYNEHFVRSSDMELNIRLKNAGGKILLVPDIVGYYYADISFYEFWKHNFKDGVWTTYPLKFTRSIFSFRHFIPFIFIGALAGSLMLSLIFSMFLLIFFSIVFLYILAALIIALDIAFKEKDIRYLLFIPAVFIIRHVGYGIGSWWGCIILGFPSRTPL